MLADTERVRILDGATLLANHRRCYDRGEQIEEAAHIQKLVEHKRAGRQHRATDELVRAVPPIRDLLVRAAARGHNLGAIATGLQRLRQQYSVTELHAAVTEAIARDAPHSNAVRWALESARAQRGQPLATVVRLPDHLQRRDVIVTPHALGSYDQLMEKRHDDDCTGDEPA